MPLSHLRKLILVANNSQYSTNIYISFFPNICYILLFIVHLKQNQVTLHLQPNLTLKVWKDSYDENKIWGFFYPLCLLNMFNSFVHCFLHVWYFFWLDPGCPIGHYIPLWSVWISFSAFDHFRFILCFISMDLGYTSASLYLIVRYALFKFLRLRGSSKFPRITQ